MTQKEKEQYCLARAAFLQSKEDFFYAAGTYGFGDSRTREARTAMQIDRQIFRELKRKHAV